MTLLRRQAITSYGAPLTETAVACPEPQDTQVLVRMMRCGVCHSDLHIHNGYFLLGADKKLDIRSGRTLPFALGHEIAGVVESAGAGAEGVAAGDAVTVYPWIGCGSCGACRRGEENICLAPRQLGITVDGGYASHVMVPHPRYLLPHAPLSASFAAILMCSGLTAYAALKRLTRAAAPGSVMLVGMGGVGMMGLSLARSVFGMKPLVADIDAAKREAALSAGAAMAFDPSDPGMRKKILEASQGGVVGVCDFVGSAQSFAFSMSTLAKGGKLVVTGLFGGGFDLPLALVVLKAMSIEGVQTGTLAEAQELLRLARDGRVSIPPLRERPLAEAQAALDELRAGRVIGRTVLCA